MIISITASSIGNNTGEFHCLSWRKSQSKNCPPSFLGSGYFNLFWQYFENPPGDNQECSPTTVLMPRRPSDLVADNDFRNMPSVINTVFILSPHLPQSHDLLIDYFRHNKLVNDNMFVLIKDFDRISRFFMDFHPFR